MTVDEALARAVAAHQAGKLADAESLYRQVLAAVPNQPDALHFMGVLAHQVGRDDVAEALIRRSISIAPTSTAWSNLGEAVRGRGRNEEAERAYREALRLDERNATAWSNLGLLLRTLKRYAESEAACRSAIEIDADFAGAWQNLCNVLGDLGRVDEAVAAGRRAVELNPNSTDAWADLGTAHIEAVQLADAVAALDRAITLRPDNASARHNLAQTLLLTGDFDRGWAEYEWRWRSPDFPSPRRNFTQPQWTGEDVSGKTVLLHAEQGFGDTIMFARYAPVVAARGARVIVECQAEVAPLLATVAGPDRVISRGDPLPPFDFHCPFLSLPRAFATRPETIPAAVPYMTAEPPKVAAWTNRLNSYSGLRVGIAWAGRPTHGNDHNRSVTLGSFAPLARVPDVTFFSLQKGPASAQANTPPAGLNLVDWTADLADFTDTAAFVTALDLVIAVDTSVVHLAGALARPVWVLVPFAPDWRWLVGRDDSPWYPTMRLFRQHRPRAWAEVFDRVATELGRRHR